MYYLNSRYYDPVVGRFINADGYVSTGQGITGYNMYSYCLNNPVNMVDYSGEIPWYYLPGSVKSAYNGARSTSSNVRRDLAIAPDLDIKKASPTSYNCYGNAIGKQIIADPTGYTPGISTQQTYELVKNDLGSNNVRDLVSVDSPIGDDEFKVALKCGTSDYHFIRLTENGWYNKSGSQSPGVYVDQSIVAADMWMGMIPNGKGGIVNTGSTYTLGTIYFAVKVGWDR